MNEGTTASGPVEARRLRLARWRDPRLLVGLLLVAASVVAGTRILAAADETTAVWAVRADVRAGTPAEVDDVERVRVHLDEDTERRYVLAEGDGSDAFVETLARRVWSHDVRAGELLARSALADARAATGAELPLRVETGSMPGDLGAGDSVDVWVSPDGQAAGAATPGSTGSERAITATRVIDVRATNAALSETGTQVVLVEVDRERREQLDDVLATLAAGKVTLVRVRGPDAT